MKELSIFVDESGDFGQISKHSPYYLVTMVFHDQTSNIEENIKIINSELKNLGLKDYTIHTEPLIRREEAYRNMYPNERRAIFTKLFVFAKNCAIEYKTFVFKKKEAEDAFKLEGRMTKEISWFIRNNLLYFQTFDKVILYYDNGQYQLNRLLNIVFNAELSRFEMRKVRPADYKLFQVADLLCTIELLASKIEDKGISKSEKIIFHSQRDFKKDFLKDIRRKMFNETRYRR